LNGTESRLVVNLADAQARESWAAFLSRGILGSARLVRNAEVEFSSVRVGDQVVPLVTNRRGAADCTWVTSVRNAYGPYARAETDIVRMNRFLQPLYVAGSHAAEMLLRAGGFSGGNYLNNWLLATNLYRPEFTSAAIHSVLDELCHAERSLPVVIRSLTPPLHAQLLAELARAGFLLLPTRQVWIVHEPASHAWRTHRDSRRDLALAEASAKQWEWVPAKDFTEGDYARALHLYQRLYRERYPAFNPDYTEHFLRIGAATGFLELTGLRPAGGGDLVGFVGMTHRAGVSCTPLLGYDIDASASLGLYRLLMLRAFLTCERRETIFHCSAGAGSFKFNRGAQSHVEFAAIWANHLPLYRRAGLRALSAVVRKCVVPYLESHRL
jgi:Acetyltransferase (GNAT) domain